MDYIVYGAVATTCSNSGDSSSSNKRVRKMLFSVPKSRFQFDADGKLHVAVQSGDGAMTSKDFRNENSVLLLKNGNPITISLIEDGKTFEYSLKMFAPRPIDDGDDVEPKVVIGFHISTFASVKKDNDDSQSRIEIERTDVFQKGAKIATFQKALRAAFLDLGLDRPIEFATVNMMFCTDALWQRLVERARQGTEAQKQGKEKETND